MSFSSYHAFSRRPFGVSGAGGDDPCEFRFDTESKDAGRFDYDPTTGAFSNINITSEEETPPAATHIATSPVNGLSPTIDFISSIATDLSGETLDDLVAGNAASLGVAHRIGTDLVCYDSDCSRLRRFRRSRFLSLCRCLLRHWAA